MIDSSFLPAGPWDELASGTLEGLEQKVWISNGRIFSAIVEKDENGIAGVLLNAYKVLYVSGDVEAFLQKIPKKVLLLVVHTKVANHSFFILDSGASYVEFSTAAMRKEAKALLARIESASKVLKNVSKAYDVSFKELDECSDEEKAAFFSLPLLSALLAPSTTKKAKPLIVEFGHGELFFGITRAGTVAKEPFDFFDKTLVFGSLKDSRLHVLHIIAESAMLSGIPLLIIDWYGAFRGLKNPNNSRNSLENFKVSLDPIGFPCRFFDASKDIGVQLNNIDGRVLVELFGIGNNIASQIIEKVFSEAKFTTLNELLERIAAQEETAKVTPFKKREAQRALELIAHIYPELFVPEIKVSELFKKWHAGLSRANVVLLSPEDLRKSFLLLHSLINAISSYFPIQKTHKLKAVLLFTAANMCIPKFKAKYTHNKIAETLVEIANKGCAIFIECEDRANINENIQKLITATIGVVSQGDAAIVIKNRRNYRVLLRPGLSACCTINQS